MWASYPFRINIRCGSSARPLLATNYIVLHTHTHNVHPRFYAKAPCTEMYIPTTWLYTASASPSGEDRFRIVLVDFTWAISPEIVQFQASPVYLNMIYNCHPGHSDAYSIGFLLLEVVCTESVLRYLSCSRTTVDSTVLIILLCI